MDKFEKLVSQCQRHGIDRSIENSAWDHALILFVYLLKDAVEKNKDIKIVSGNLNSIFYDEVYRRAKEYFLKIPQKSLKIEVIVLNNKNDFIDNEFSRFIKNHGGLIRYIKSDISGYDGPHFMLVGKDAYRVEVDHEKTKALANFNNSKVGNMLHLLFGELRERTIAA